MAEIFLRAPMWVWGVLMGLIVLGLLLTRERKATPLRLLIPSAIFTVYSFVGVLMGFPAILIPLLSWLAGAMIALGVIRPALGAAWARMRTKPRDVFPVRGSYVPLALFLGIFLARYTLNVVKAVHPGFLASLSAMMGIAGLLGLFSGLLFSRALKEIGRAG